MIIWLFLTQASSPALRGLPQPGGRLPSQLGLGPGQEEGLPWQAGQGLHGVWDKVRHATIRGTDLFLRREGITPSAGKTRGQFQTPST